MSNILQDKNFVNVSTDKTLTIASSGIVQNVIADNLIITLPATATGGTYIIHAGGVKPTGSPDGAGTNESMLITIRPQAADKIQGGITGAANDDKDIILTKATMKVGDYVVIGLGQTDGPVIHEIKGTWTREA